MKRDPRDAGERRHILLGRFRPDREGDRHRRRFVAQGESRFESVGRLVAQLEECADSGPGRVLAHRERGDSDVAAAVESLGGDGGGEVVRRPVGQQDEAVVAVESADGAHEVQEVRLVAVAAPGRLKPVERALDDRRVVGRWDHDVRAAGELDQRESRSGVLGQQDTRALDRAGKA